MRTRSTKTNLIIAVALIVLTGIFIGGCKQCQISIDSSRLDLRMTGADSLEEIENSIKASLAKKYGPEDTTDAFAIYHVTNGITSWAFIKAYNAPRGLAMFNLYCYEQEKAGHWLLRAYVPINEYFYTNNLDRDLIFKTEDDYVKVVFRGVTVFTGASTK